MANSIKESGGGLALQVTRPARQAGLVEEDTEGNATRLAGVHVYGFDDLLLVVDSVRVSVSDRAELVATAATDTGSIHEGATATVEIAGHGYQVQLPGSRQAGLNVGDNAPVVSAVGLLAIHDGTNPRVADDLVAIRNEQS